VDDATGTGIGNWEVFDDKRTRRHETQRSLDVDLGKKNCYRDAVRTTVVKAHREGHPPERFIPAADVHTVRDVIVWVSGANGTSRRKSKNVLERSIVARSSCALQQCRWIISTCITYTRHNATDTPWVTHSHVTIYVIVSRSGQSATFNHTGTFDHVGPRPLPLTDRVLRASPSVCQASSTRRRRDRPPHVGTLGNNDETLWERDVHNYDNR